MIRQLAFLASVAVVVTGFQSSVHAIDVTPTDGGGPSPQTLAETIADSLGGVTVAVSPGVTTMINDPKHGNPNSDPRAMGTFTNGITASGTPLLT